MRAGEFQVELSCQETALTRWICQVTLIDWVINPCLASLQNPWKFAWDSVGTASLAGRNGAFGCMSWEDLAVGLRRGKEGRWGSA